MREPTTILFTLPDGTHIVHSYEYKRRDGSTYTKHEAWRPDRGFFMLGIGSEYGDNCKIHTNHPAGEMLKESRGEWSKRDSRGDWVPLGIEKNQYKGGGRL